MSTNSFVENVYFNSKKRSQKKDIVRVSTINTHICCLFGINNNFIYVEHYVTNSTEKKLFKVVFDSINIII